MRRSWGQKLRPRILAEMRPGCYDPQARVEDMEAAKGQERVGKDATFEGGGEGGCGACVEREAEVGRVEVERFVLVDDTWAACTAGLVDHMHLVQVPIVLGRGVRVWDGLEDLQELKLIDSIIPEPLGGAQIGV